MKTTRIIAAVLVALFAFTPLAKAGRIVVANDDWIFWDGVGFEPPRDGAQFAQNVARWFVGTRSGNFLAYSTHPSLTNDDIRTAIESAGHTWTVDISAPFNLETLRAYDGVFIGGDKDFSSDMNIRDVLIAYVNTGGNIYVFSAGNLWDYNWNSLLEVFGLRLGDLFRHNGSVPISSAHPLFAGVDYLLTVSGAECVGGLVGINFAFINDCRIFASYSTGIVSGRDYVGGLVGTNSGTFGGPDSEFSDIVASYSSGSVNGRNHVGGLVGENHYGSVTMCYKTGSVNGDEWVGGLVGSNGRGGHISHSFWDIDVCGQTVSAGGMDTAAIERRERTRPGSQQAQGICQRSPARRRRGHAASNAAGTFANFPGLLWSPRRCRRSHDSIPYNNFLRLAAGSAVIDKGVDIGMPFVGPRPDLGAFEYDPDDHSSGYVKMLHQAVRDHDLKQIEQLLAEGEGVNDKDWLGYTPLHWAVYFGYPDLIELLISKGADPNIQSDTGRYALEIARSMAYHGCECA